MLGVDSRANLLRGLGRSLLAHPDIFGEAGRPGNAVGKFVIQAINDILLNNHRLSVELRQ